MPHTDTTQVHTSAPAHLHRLHKGHTIPEITVLAADMGRRGDQSDRRCDHQCDSAVGVGNHTEEVGVGTVFGGDDVAAVGKDEFVPGWY
jgi:hypothetical protein